MKTEVQNSHKPKKPQLNILAVIRSKIKKLLLHLNINKL